MTPLPRALAPPLSGRRLLLAAALAVAAGCATAPSAPADDVALVARLRAARFVLLGEVHDNADQHRQRADLLRTLLADGRPTRVVFEQMDRSRDTAIAAAPRDAEAVASAGALDREGWRWPLHEPIVSAALAAGAKVVGGNLDRGQVRAIVRGGPAAAPSDLQAALEDPRWSADQQAELESEINVGHCKALPPSQWAPMAWAQRSRDAAMASALLGAKPGERAVLIAGNGHVRSDRGVPHYLRAAGVDSAQIVSLGFVEDSADTAPFDVRRQTPRAEREDPCAAFRP